MVEKRVYVKLSWEASWSPEDLGLQPDVTQKEMEKALDAAITDFINSGVTAVDPPDEIETEFCGWEVQK